MAENLPTPVPTGAPRTVLDSVPGLNQLLMLVGIAASVAAAIWLVLWSQGPNYSLLYGQLAEREAGAVIDALNAAGIPYKFESGSGAVLVPEAQVHEARIKLAGQGLPQSDGLGVELIQQDAGFGTSQAMENARFQHALETELARTISKVQGVQSARVHLALPRPAVFVTDRKKASASVMLQLYSGRRLEPGQVAAIVHLVASSVPDLEAGQVTLVDQNGSLLNSPEDGDDMSIAAKQFEYTRALEESYAHRIEDLLSPIVGADSVRARVTAELDITVSEQTREDYDPAQTAVRSEQTSNDKRMAGDLAQGIPGALSNQPPGTAGAPPAAQQQPATTPPQPVSTSERSTRNFEVDRTISHTRQPSGVLRKLSVAVIVDDWRRVDEEGNSKATPLSEAEITRLTGIVKEAVGFDEARGDRVSVTNTSFKVTPPPAEAEEAAVSMLDQPWVKAALKQGTGAVLVLLLIFVILKPIMRTLTQPARGGGLDLGGDRVSLGGQVGFQPSYDQQVAAARSMVGQDPQRAAQVMKEWVNGG